eukprot:m.6047 g.6047  ORF g.6047 m.6047 type:complete len:525 (+) comp4837_c0_seq1:86-1660(+)
MSSGKEGQHGGEASKPKLSFSLNTTKKNSKGSAAGKNVLLAEGFESSPAFDGFDGKKKNGEEGKELKGLNALFSVDKERLEKEKQEEELLVIPMEKDKDWRNSSKRTTTKKTTNSRSSSNEDTEENNNIQKKEEEAAVSSLSPEKDENITMMTEDERFQQDLAERPDEADMQTYEDVPVEEFGAALLRGMGWKKGEAIGGTFKGLAEPVEYVPRMNRLGLGAKRDLEIKPDLKHRQKRYIKPGETREKKSHGVAKVGADGKVRHIKKLSEEVRDEEVATMKRGAYVLINRGPHRGHAAKVTRLFNLQAEIELALSGNAITVEEKILAPVKRAVYKQRIADLRKYGIEKVLRKKNASNSENSSSGDSGKRREKDGNNRYNEDDSDSFPPNKKPKSSSSASSGNKNKSKRRKPVWVCPGICVRIVSETFKSGKYYNSKVKVVDVMAIDAITCATDTGKLLEHLRQKDLETVIPKKELAPVRVVSGEYKGLNGRMLKRNKSKETVIVQLEDDDTVQLSYDDISSKLE